MYNKEVESTVGLNISLSGIKRVTEPTKESWERKLLVSSNINVEDYILNLLNDISNPSLIPVYYDYKLVTVVDEDEAKIHQDVWKVI